MKAVIRATFRPRGVILAVHVLQAQVHKVWVPLSAIRVQLALLHRSEVQCVRCARKVPSQAVAVQHVNLAILRVFSGYIPTVRI